MEPHVHDATLDMNIARNQLLTTLERVSDEDWNRYVPYGSWTLHDLLAHLAGADQAWAITAQGLLRTEGVEQRTPPEDSAAARQRAIERRRAAAPAELLDEMARRRRLLISLYELLEPRHLALALPSYGERHNSVHERIWRGYHDRLHHDDIKRALAMTWHPQNLRFLPELQPAVDALAVDETLYVIYSVDPIAWDQPSPDPNWTNRQLLAHIATGDWVLQTHLQHIIEHGAVAAWPDVDAGNAARLDERRVSTEHALIEEYLSMRHQTLRLLSQLAPAHLALPIELWWRRDEGAHSVLDYVLGFDAHERRHHEQLRPAMKYARATGGK